MFVYGADFCVATETAVARSVYDTGFCVATKTAVDIGLFMTLTFVLPLKL